MTSPWQLPTIAISTLGLAALLLIQKQQNRSLTDEILTAEQTFETLIFSFLLFPSETNKIIQSSVNQKRFTA